MPLAAPPREPGPADAQAWGTVSDFLSRELFGRWDLVLAYDVGKGLRPLAGPDPVVSINRGFTAPVVIERELAREDLVFLAAQDDDPFARYEALQELAVGHLVGTASGALSAEEQAAGEAAIIGAFRSSIADIALDDAMRGELMMLPSEAYLFEVMANGERLGDPGAIHAAREGLKAAIGTALAGELDALHARTSAVALDDPAGRGARKVKTQALVLLDRALWTFEEREFVPHLRVDLHSAGNDLARRTPVWLVEGPLPS